jgi:hypothetical protein
MPLQTVEAPMIVRRDLPASLRPALRSVGAHPPLTFRTWRRESMRVIIRRRLRCKEGWQQINSSRLQAGNTFEEVNLDGGSFRLTKHP